MSDSVSLTLKAAQLMRVLRTSAFVSPAFNPMNLAANLHPPSFQFDAIWDTGATGTAISQRVVDACKLKPVGITRVQTAGGLAECEVYLVNLTLPNQVCFHNVTAPKADLGQDRHLLIGMDIITKGDFAITNQNGKTCFSFRVPSSVTIDFRAEPSH